MKQPSTPGGATPQNGALRKRKYANGGRALAGALEAHARLEREVIRLREIEHAAWHLLDDSETNGTSGEVTVLQSTFEALSSLLPEGHPEIDEQNNGSTEARKEPPLSSVHNGERASPPSSAANGSGQVQQAVEARPNNRADGGKETNG